MNGLLPLLIVSLIIVGIYLDKENFSNYGDYNWHPNDNESQYTCGPSCQGETGKNCCCKDSSCNRTDANGNHWVDKNGKIVVDCNGEVNGQYVGMDHCGFDGPSYDGKAPSSGDGGGGGGDPRWWTGGNGRNINMFDSDRQQNSNKGGSKDNKKKKKKKGRKKRDDWKHKSHTSGNFSGGNSRGPNVTGSGNCPQGCATDSREDNCTIKTDSAGQQYKDCPQTCWSPIDAPQGYCEFDSECTACPHSKIPLGGCNSLINKNSCAKNSKCLWKGGQCIPASPSPSNNHHGRNTGGGSFNENNFTFNEYVGMDFGDMSANLPNFIGGNRKRGNDSNGDGAGSVIAPGSTTIIFSDGRRPTSYGTANGRENKYGYDYRDQYREYDDDTYRHRNSRDNYYDHQENYYRRDYCKKRHSYDYHKYEKCKSRTDKGIDAGEKCKDVFYKKTKYDRCMEDSYKKKRKDYGASFYDSSSSPTFTTNSRTPFDLWGYSAPYSNVMGSKGSLAAANTDVYIKNRR